MADNKLDISSTAVEKALDVVSEFFKTLVKEPLQELGGMLTDKIRFQRAFLQAKNVTKVKEKCEKAGINPKQLNMKVLVPYLDTVAIEEEETLQNVWADLITNYLDPKKNLTITVYPNVLKELSTDEVNILHEMVKGQRYSINADYPQKHLNTIGIDICSNLERLGLIKEELVNPSKSDSFGTTVIWVKEPIMGRGIFEITAFGREFVKACTRDGQ